MTNPQGESVNALYGFIRSYNKILKDFSPEQVVAVFDGPDNKKSRTDIYSEYKGHRKSMPEDLFPQLEKAVEFCHIAGIPTLTIPGVEADDTMGSIAIWAEKMGAEAYICSSDKDLCQLITDHIFVINPHKENLVIDKNKVVELFGVKPTQMIDYLAMVGDASDNIPGLEGFGPKTVCTLLKEHETLEYILQHPELLSGKKKETLIEQKEIALMSKKLATIQTDIEFPKTQTFFQQECKDLSALENFYKENHFMSLLKELDLTKKTLGQQSKQPEITSFNTIVVDSEETLLKMTQSLSIEAEICFSILSDEPDPMKGSITAISFAAKESEIWFVPYSRCTHKQMYLDRMNDLFSSPNISFYGHDIKHHLHILLNEKMHAPEINFDTILASYVLRPQTSKHNIELLALEKFSKQLSSLEELTGKGKKRIPLHDVELNGLTTFCSERMAVIMELKKTLTKELEEQKLDAVFYDIEIPLLPVLLTMERNGIFLDKEDIKKMSSSITNKISKIEEEIYDLASERFNLNSPKQLGVVLFEKLGLPSGKKTLTGYSTSAEVLESLKNKSPIIPKILEYRGLEKLRSTYIDALPEFVNESTRRIHCTFNQSVTATGRLSCQDPNLQNIPVRSDEGKKIREAFKPQHKDYTFLAADYSQIELRLLAHLSADESLIKSFNSNEDVHSFTASLVFEVPIDQVTPEMRYQAKAVNFGIIYGQQAFGLSQELGIDVKQASTFIKKYFERYPKVKEFLESSKDTARALGYAETITGRKRPIPELDNKNQIIRSAAERLATNTPLQGTAADLIKLAMIKIHNILKESDLDAKMILQVHDELVFEVVERDKEKLREIVKNAMEHIFTLRVPLDVDISFGKNWGEC